MSTMETPSTNLLDRAHELIDTAADRDVDLRLVGSGGFRELTDASVHRNQFEREMGDIDLVGRSADADAIRELFENFDYEIDKDLLLAGWGNRYVFYGGDHEVDVFLDEISMCHTLDLRDRLTIGPNSYALAPADLLLEKAQIVEINEKDLKDITLLLMELPLTEDDTGVNHAYMADLLAQDWGFYHTVTTNLRKVEHYLDRTPITDDDRTHVTNQLSTLLDHIESEPKSLKWKLRAKIGERVQWYTEVEEKHR